MNLAAVWNLPVIFFCENNAWAECTPMAGLHTSSISRTVPPGTGCGASRSTAMIPVTVHDAVAEAATRARNGEGPTFVEAVAYRLQGHYFGDPMDYVDADELAAARAAAPFERFRVATGR